MDSVKTSFIQSVLAQSKQLDKNSFLPFILSMQKNAREKGISFTEKETDMIYEQLKNNFSMEERRKLELLRQIMKSGSGSKSENE
ncbi:MAG: hypothetical protein MR487_01765 [Lachnospiraceae bacterium]|nr:hypothetical protein [Lachnospiraceae bacterium]